MRLQDLFCFAFTELVGATLRNGKSLWMHLFLRIQD
jgi:hypothetical protein